MKQIVPSGRLFNYLTPMGPHKMKRLFFRRGSSVRNSIGIFAFTAAAKSGTNGVADIRIRFFQIRMSSIVFILWKDRFWNSSITFMSPNFSLAGD